MWDDEKTEDNEPVDQTIGYLNFTGTFPKELLGKEYEAE
tara:strand:+ start:2721 stop:2837 length:117 start_codon:yes stop_codon:yes gene_type:complete